MEIKSLLLRPCVLFRPRLRCHHRRDYLTMFQPPPSPNHPSIPIDAASVSFTPHRTYAGSHGVTDKRDTARRHIFEDPHVRSRHSSDTVREDTYTTRLCRTNLRIVQEIANQEKFTIDSDMIQDMLNNKSSAKWSIYRYETLDLALRGLIPIIDKKIVLEDIVLFCYWTCSKRWD